jgi:hypothetical protein
VNKYRNGKYIVRIFIDGKSKHMGYFENVEDANKVRIEAEELKKVQDSLKPTKFNITDNLTKGQMRCRANIKGKIIDISVSYRRITKEQAKLKLIEKVDNLFT